MQARTPSFPRRPAQRPHQEARESVPWPRGAAAAGRRGWPTRGRAARRRRKERVQKRQVVSDASVHRSRSTEDAARSGRLRRCAAGEACYHPRQSMAGLFPQRAETRELVLSPQESLVAGGPAEQLEQLIQASFKQGVQRVFVDLRAVPALDSAGVRALVRGHTSAERLGRQFCLVAPNPRVLDVLRLSHLDQVFAIRDSVSLARVRPWPWVRILTALGVALVGAGLVATGYFWPDESAREVGQLPDGTPITSAIRWDSPLFELAKLAVAAVIGMLVTVVQRNYRSDRTPNPTLDQAQVLLCISGALMMIII